MIIERVTEAEREVLDELMQEYLAELAPLANEEVPFENGRYIYYYFDFYFRDLDRWAFLVYQDEQPAGFVMTRAEIDPNNGETVHEVAEFYVRKSYRRSGLGSELAKKIWSHSRGRWQLGVLKKNVGAYAFWRRLIEEVDQEFTESPPSKATNQMFRFEFTIR